MSAVDRRRTLGSLLLAGFCAVLVSSCGGGREGVALLPAPGVVADSSSIGSAATPVHSSSHASEQLWQTAVERLEVGDPEAADRLLIEAWTADSTGASILSLRSRVWFRLGRHEEAIAALERHRLGWEGAASSSEYPLELLAALALHHAAAGQVEVAEALLDSYYAPGPHWSKIGSVLAYVALRSAHPERRGPSAAERALQADGDAPEALNNQGIALLVRGDPETARIRLEQAHALDPDLPGPLYNLAIVEQFYFFREEKARAWFDLYLERSDLDPDGLKSILTPSRAEVER
ncbi:MAG: hypothetical protein IPK72_03680 [Candidatus Eisenbacteria bacterium]|nr:hypothetical protein [Candidatus Eisenbacteria bacterium]